MQETLIRQWHLLQMLPFAPRKAAAPVLTQKLCDLGFSVELRTVQRDLHKLSMTFPIVVDEVHKPYGWSWARNAKVFDLPGIDAQVAVAFLLADAWLAHLMPAAVREGLRRHVDQAREALSASGNRLAAWPTRVAVVPQGLPTAAPIIDPLVFEEVHAAVLDGRVLTARYRRRAEQRAQSYTLHPLGLVWREQVGYLLAMANDHQDVLQLALHRFVAAESTSTAARTLDGFDLQAYVNSGAMAFRVSDQTFSLVLRLDPMAGARVVETPLAPDQTVETDADGQLVLRATVADTIALRSWLLGFGPFCEVVEPAPLRAEIAASLRAAADRYGAVSTSAPTA